MDRGILREDFYFLSDEVLTRFKLFQGFDADAPFPGFPTQQAYLIWAQSPLSIRRALAEANGFQMIDQPILPGEAYIVFEDQDRHPIESVIIKNNRWYK